MRAYIQYMYHNRLDVNKIERWSRWLSWFYLVSIPLNILTSVLNIYQLFTNPESLRLVATIDPSLLRLTYGAGYFNAIFYPVIPFLLLQGVSKTLRYLLALKGEYGRSIRR